MPVYIEKVEIWSDVTIAGQTTKQTKRKDRATPESEKPRQRVSNADRKVFANLESFCKSGKFLQKAHYWLKNFLIFGKCPDTIQNIQIICKVSG